MANYNYKLTEEIARWAFEIKCKQSDNWHIAFTNPTAGPWKAIKASDSTGVIGEVYRFILEEVRPDIVIYNDILETIIIIEAKDTLPKLISGVQAKKSIEVMVNLSKILTNLHHSIFWDKRANYTIITGLLWGTEASTTFSQRDRVFDEYYKEIKKFSELDSRLIIGIETYKQSDGSISCSVYSKSFEKKGLETISPTAIAQSLNLNLN